MKGKKGLSSIVVIIAIVAIVVAIGVFMAVKKGSNLNVYNKGGGQQVTQQQPSIPAIKNSSDLDATAADLDKTDVDGMDSKLNQIDTDASTF